MTGAAEAPGYRVWALPGLPEVRPGDDLVKLIAAAANGPGAPQLADGDVVLVTSKIVSKAEGRIVEATDREAAIDAETVRVVARRGTLRIVENRSGLVMAAAGVDASNTPSGTILLLPEDADASARALRAGLREALGVNVGVVVTDTFGRPWRSGLTDVAIGAAGVRVLDDLRGGTDAYGNPLVATIVATADELAAAGDLVKGKATGLPVAVVRGLPQVVLPADATEPAADSAAGPEAGSGGDVAAADPGARALVRNAADDMFRLGTSEAVREAVTLRRTVREFTDHPVDPGAVRRGDVLRKAPYLAVPCMVLDGAHAYPDARRGAAEREMFVVAHGAGIQNFLVALAGERLGSAWISSTMFCRDVVREALQLPAEWEPMGAVAIGRPAAPPRERPARPVDGFISVR